MSNMLFSGLHARRTVADTRHGMFIQKKRPHAPLYEKQDYHRITAVVNCVVVFVNGYCCCVHGDYGLGCVPLHNKLSVINYLIWASPSCCVSGILHCTYCNNNLLLFNLVSDSKCV